MSKARFFTPAVTVERRPVSEVARSYGVARSWIYALLDRYRDEGEAAFQPRSRRPKTSPNAVSDETADLIVRLRKDLSGQGLDAGPHTIAWHLEHRYRVQPRPPAPRPPTRPPTKNTPNPIRVQGVLDVLQHHNCGAMGIRTPDLFHAME